MSSCRKHESIEKDYVVMDTGMDSPITAILQTNDSTILASGGNYQRDGFILRSNNGTNWYQVPTFFSDKKIACINQGPNETLYAGSELGYYYTSSDGGLNWQIPWQNISVPFHEENRGVIKKFVFPSSSHIKFISGRDLNIGNFYNSNDVGATWQFDTLFNELNDIDYLNENQAWTCGHGYIGKWNNGQIEQIDLVGKDFVSVEIISENEILLLSRKGKLYESTDGGEKWDKIWQVSGSFQRRPYLTDMYFIDNNHGFICGKFGDLFETLDGGDTWKQIELSKDLHLNHLSSFGGKLWVACDNGKLIRIVI
jgi:hypothetical protein